MYKGRLLATLLTTVALSLFSTATSADTKPTAGLYKIEVKIENTTLPVPRNSSSEQCITQGEFAAGPNSFLDQQQPQQDCKLVDSSYAGGNISMKMECTLPGGGKAVIDGSGSYTSNSFQLTNKMKMSISGMDMQMTTTATGTRVGDC